LVLNHENISNLLNNYDKNYGGRLGATSPIKIYGAHKNLSLGKWKEYLKILENAQNILHSIQTSF